MMIFTTFAMWRDMLDYSKITRMLMLPFLLAFLIQGISCWIDIRLGNGGRLEVYRDGQWGTVCNTNFDPMEATVACRALGYYVGGVRYTCPAGSGPIWLDDVDCDDSSCTLDDCGHRGWGVHNCSHSDDVCVACKNPRTSARIVCFEGHSNQASHSLRLTWNLDWWIFGPRQFRVEYKKRNEPDSSYDVHIDNYMCADRQIRMTNVMGLEPETEYTFRSAVGNGQDFTDYHSIHIMITWPVNPPEAFTLYPNQTSSSVTLTWRPGICHRNVSQVFTLEYKQTNTTGSQYTLYGADNPQTSSSDGTIYQHITGLEPDTMYTFRLSAHIDQFTTEYRYLNAATTVMEDNDHFPDFTQKIYQVTISENFPAGASIVSVSATDQDIGSNTRLTYTLPHEQDREYFEITTVEATNTGVLRLYQAVDFDFANCQFFNLTVQVSDSDPMHTDLAYIEVHITDYNDNPPVFMPSSQRVRIFEDVMVGNTFAKFQAIDKDAGKNKEIYYVIDHDTDPSGQLEIDYQTPDHNGVYIITTKHLDRETKPLHWVHILAIDKGTPPQTGTGTLIVTLADVNDNYPTFFEDYRPVIYEDERPGTTVTTISAKDLDTATNGPPFEFWLPCQGGCPCAQNPTCNDFDFLFTPGGGRNTYGAGTVTTRRTFDREEQKYLLMPIVMKDSGHPSQTGTNTLTITIGDRNDNKHYPAHKNINVYNYKGMFQNAPLGNVYARDPDDWDAEDKEFTFRDTETGVSELFVLDQYSGMLWMKDRLQQGEYNLTVSVYDRTWKRAVISSVTVTVKEVTDDAIYNSASFRFKGITAQEFIERPYIGPDVADYGKSKYDLLREMIAWKLGISVTYVDLFTVMNHPTTPISCDVHFAVYYRPDTLGYFLSDIAQEFVECLGSQVAMMPIDECMEVRCESGGCSNKLVTTSDPLLINTNGTSLVGITAYIEATCEHSC